MRMLVLTGFLTLAALAVVQWLNAVTAQYRVAYPFWCFYMTANLVFALRGRRRRPGG